MKIHDETPFYWALDNGKETQYKMEAEAIEFPELWEWAEYF